MSASNKKQLRKEQQNEMLTARQREEQAEAKKLRSYTIGFVAVMIAVILVAIGSLIYSGVNNSGIFQRNTIAAEVNGEELNSVVMNYYYHDAINAMYENAYNQYSSYYELYLEAMGLDLSKPLNEQNNAQAGKTWAEYFLDTALDSAKHDYTLAKLATENGFTLPEESKETLESQMNNLEANAKLYGYSGADTYLRLVYGTGADAASYKAYLEKTALAEAYYQNNFDSLTYDDAKREAYAKDKVNDYNSYDYSYVYVSYSAFLAEKEDENATYTEEEKTAAREEAKKLADELYALGNLDDIRDKIVALEEVDLTVNDRKNELHTSATKVMADWLSAEGRVAGEIGLLENASAAEEGEEPVVNGYYVICFTAKTDNSKKMSNVRHLLVAFEGGTEDEVSGELVYTAEEKEAAKNKAEELLQQWKDDGATKEGFIELVKEFTDDEGSAEEGGLYENIHPASEYVANFLSWSINPERTVGETGIVETEYGYHVMYFDSYSELSYRDSLIESEMKAADQEAWYNGCMENATAALADTSKIPMDMVISG